MPAVMPSPIQSPNRPEMRKQYSEGNSPVIHAASTGQPKVGNDAREVSFDKHLPREAFAYMVLHESDHAEWSWRRTQMLKVISHMYFDACMGFVIVVNAIIIGVEIEYEGDVSMTFFQILDVFFLSIFLLELTCKLYVFRAKYFSRCVNIGDLIIVIFGVIALVLHIQGSDSEMKDDMRKVTVLKLARLLRLVRMLRLSTQFHSLWIIIHGLSGCMNTVMWTTVLLVTVTYFFAVVAIEFISADPEVQQLEFDLGGGTTFGERFESIPKALLSLLTFFAIENVSTVGWRLMRVRPWTFLYLGAWTLVVPIVLLNLITAVIVEISVNAAKKDERHQQALEFQEWQNICKVFDELFIKMTHELDRKNSARSTRTSQMMKEVLEASRATGGWREKMKRLVNSFYRASTLEEKDEETLVDFGKKLTRHRVQDLKDNVEVRERLNLLFGEAPNSLRGFDRLMELWVVLDTDDDNQISMAEFTEGLGRLATVINSHNADTFVMLRIVQEMKKAHDERSQQASLLAELQKSQLAICEQVKFLTAEVKAWRSDKSEGGGELRISL